MHLWKEFEQCQLGRAVYAGSSVRLLRWKPIVVHTTHLTDLHMRTARRRKGLKARL